MAIAATPAQIVLRGLPAEVSAVIRRRPLAAAAPAAVLGAGADAIVFAQHEWGLEVALGILLALLFELYVGYAELIVASGETEPRVPVGRLLRRALPRTPALVVASLIAVSLPLTATALLVIPAFWLITRWALFAPAIVHERLRPLPALRRSADLVRGAFWPVAASVTLSLFIEHAVIHGTAHAAEPALGSHLLGLIGAAIATAIVSPPAAFTISLVYERLERVVRP